MRAVRESWEGLEGVGSGVGLDEPQSRAVALSPPCAFSRSIMPDWSGDESTLNERNGKPVVLGLTEGPQPMQSNFRAMLSVGV